jgi:hypothetical protein
MDIITTSTMAATASRTALIDMRMVLFLSSRRASRCKKRLISQTLSAMAVE